MYMYINLRCNIKSTCRQVANLFARDEMDEIQGELIPIMKKEFPRRPPTNENLYEYFLSRTRQNLHVVLNIFLINIKEVTNFCVGSPKTHI